MATLIEYPTRVQAAGNKPKLIDEFLGSSKFRFLCGEHCPYAKSTRMARAGTDTENRRIYRGLAWDAADGNETGGAARSGGASSDDRSRRLGAQ